MRRIESLEKKLVASHAELETKLSRDLATLSAKVEGLAAQLASASAGITSEIAQVASQVESAGPRPLVEATRVRLKAAKKGVGFIDAVGGDGVDGGGGGGGGDGSDDDAPSGRRGVWPPPQPSPPLGKASRQLTGLGPGYQPPRGPD